MKTQSEENLEANMKKIESFGKDGADAQAEENNNQDAKKQKMRLILIKTQVCKIAKKSR